MNRLIRKQQTSGTVLLAATVLFTVFIQALAPHCICGPTCAMQEEAVAKASHACCDAAKDASSPARLPGASLIKQCNCPPVLHEAAPVITNAPEHGQEHFKAFAVAAALPCVIAARDCGHVAISESPPPKQSLTTLKCSLRC